MDFSTYLHSVIYEHKVEENQFLLRNLEAQYYNKDAQTKIINEPEKVINGLKKYVQEGHLLLLGKAGSGKTTALEMFIRDQAQTSLLDNMAPIPILIPLRSLRNNFGILEAIVFALKKADPELDINNNDIHRLLIKRSILLMLDGVNEIPSEELRTDVDQFRKDYSKTLMIFSAREFGMSLRIKHRFEMCELTSLQIQSFVQNYLPEHADGIISQINEPLLELIKTPLLLKILCDIYDPESKQIPESKGELFRAIDTKLNTWKIQEGVRAGEKFWQWNGEVLRYLAFIMLAADETPTQKWLQFDRPYAELLLELFLQGRVKAPGEKAKEWIHDLIRYHLLKFSDDTTKIEFHHQLFHEYYAAEYLLHQVRKHPEWLDKKTNKSYVVFQQQYLNQLKWTESVSVVLSLVTEQNVALQIISLALEVDWMLGAHLAGAVRREFQGSAIELISKLKLDPLFVIDLLDKTKSTAAISRLRKLAEISQREDVRKKAIETIDRMELKFTPYSAQSTEIIRSKTNNDSADPSSLATYMLLRMSGSSSTRWYQLGNQRLNDKEVRLEETEESIAELVGKLKNDDERQSASIILGWVGSDIAIESLLALYYSSKPTGSEPIRYGIRNEIGDSELRRVVAWVLGRIGTDRAINALLKLLDNKEYYMRCEAAEALAYIGTEPAIKAASIALNDSNFWVRWRAARALGDIGSDKAMEVLIEAINHPFEAVRGRAADALANIHTIESIQLLLTAVEDPDLQVGARAAEALGKIYAESEVVDKIVTEKAISTLCKAYRNCSMIDDDEPYFLCMIVKALGSFESDLIVKTLLHALESHYYWSRAYAVVSLGNLKDTACILPDIQSIISSVDYSEEAVHTLLILQSNCQFYNYEISKLAKDVSEPPSIDLHAKLGLLSQTINQMSEQPSIIIGSVTGGILNVAPNQGTQSYSNIEIQNNKFNSDDSLKAQLTELTQFIADISAKHPRVQAETDATIIIKSEFRTVQAKDLVRWKKLRHQMLLLKVQFLNPDRHLQGLKAGLVEVANHFFEDSVWAKAILAYIDKLSDITDQ